MTYLDRYPGADTRHPHFRQIMLDDALALSSATEAVAMVREGIRKAFSPDVAEAILKEIGEAR